MDVDREALGLELLPCGPRPQGKLGVLAFLTLLGCVQAWVINSRPNSRLKLHPWLGNYDLPAKSPSARPLVTGWGGHW